MKQTVRLTQYSHGAGCGCKISPKVLETILHSEQAKFVDPNLLVGNETRDDAAVYDLGNGTGIISTTDFFMPIVDARSLKYDGYMVALKRSGGKSDSPNSRAIAHYAGNTSVL